MWTIIILVLFLVVAIIALALALRAKPSRRKNGVRNDDAPEPGFDHGGDGDAD